MLMFVVATSACGTSSHLDEVSDVTQADLVGTWRGADESLLILKGGERFEARSLKTSYTAGAGVHVESKEVVSGTGKWAFGHYTKDWVINLWFESSGSATLFIASADGEKVIWAWVGDGDSFILKKRGAQARI
ncbi:hypothetical protein MHW47_02200 [Streptomyces sp. OfavH-34-F]|uniref:hypothetical protein n=1 Tax=Streptomyces sp. OfavH-34-F TaxID=2917760 RepID=UPI001EF2F064|nr:hypothetical protein [Streptomyces sp. OfavH-34-F]MCG7523267.1 hypothetical protein [Streptomyces sp. OfavH-34-F]